MRRLLIERLAADLAAVQCVGQGLQARGNALPAVQCRLHGLGDICRRGIARKVAADDDELAVAAAVIEGCEFHRGVLSCACLVLILMFISGPGCRRTCGRDPPSNRYSRPGDCPSRRQTGSPAAGTWFRT